MRPLRPFAALLVVVALATPARAESPATEADAERLFREAKDLMASGNVAEACTKLAEAKRIEVGGGIVLALALCHAKEHLNATALGEFREALALAIDAKRADRVRVAEEGISSLESKVSSLSVVAPQGVVVRVNREPWGHARLGVAVPVDGGDYEVLAEATGKVSWTQTIHLAAEGDARRVEVPTLVDAAPPAATPTTQAAPQAVEPAPTEPHRSGPPIGGYVVGGAGALGLIVAGAFGVAAVVERGDSSCGGHVCAGAEGTYANAQAAATVATVAAIAGGLALGTGAVILFAGRSDGAATRKASLAITPVLAPGSAGVAVGGGF